MRNRKLKITTELKIKSRFEIENVKVFAESKVGNNGKIKNWKSPRHRKLKFLRNWKIQNNHRTGQGKELESLKIEPGKRCKNARKIPRYDSNFKFPISRWMVFILVIIMNLWAEFRGFEVFGKFWNLTHAKYFKVLMEWGGTVPSLPTKIVQWVTGQNWNSHSQNISSFGFYVFSFKSTHNLVH